MQAATWRATLALVMMLTFAPLTVEAQPAGGPADGQRQQQESEFKAAVEAVQRVAKDGPATVALADQGQIALPAGYVFIPRPEASRLLAAMGNRTGDSFLGLLISAKEGLRWFALVSHIKAGYVKDDDAKDWKADELLQQLRDGTESGNEERRSRGFPPIEVGGWIEPPAYDAVTHRLVWSALVRPKSAAGADKGSANYNTYALGREGYFQLNLVTDTSTVNEDKRHAHILLAALRYAEGKRYEDFDVATDRVAEYGLAALIAGAAAKKLGLFAVFLAFLLKSWKIVAIGVLAFGGVLGKLLGRKKNGA